MTQQEQKRTTMQLDENHINAIKYTVADSLKQTINEIATMIGSSFSVDCVIKDEHSLLLAAEALKYGSAFVKPSVYGNSVVVERHSQMLPQHIGIYLKNLNTKELDQTKYAAILNAQLEIGRQFYNQTQNISTEQYNNIIENQIALNWLLKKEIERVGTILSSLKNLEEYTSQIPTSNNKTA